MDIKSGILAAAPDAPPTAFDGFEQVRAKLSDLGALNNELRAALPGSVPHQALERRLTEQFSQVQQLDTIAGEAASGKRGFPDRPDE